MTNLLLPRIQVSLSLAYLLVLVLTRDHRCCCLLTTPLTLPLNILDTQRREYNLLLLSTKFIVLLRVYEQKYLQDLDLNGKQNLEGDSFFYLGILKRRSDLFMFSLIPLPPSAVRVELTIKLGTGPK